MFEDGEHNKSDQADNSETNDRFAPTWGPEEIGILRRLTVPIGLSGMDSLPALSLTSESTSHSQPVDVPSNSPALKDGAASASGTEKSETSGEQKNERANDATGRREVKNADGSSITTDRLGRVVETVNIDGTRRSFEYQNETPILMRIREEPDDFWTMEQLWSGIPAPGQMPLCKWTCKGKEPFVGIKRVLNDGSIVSIHADKTAEIEKLDSSFIKTDAAGRPVFRRTADSAEITYKYADGKVSEIIEVNANQETRIFDAAGKLVRLKYDGGRELSFDSNGLVSKAVSDNGVAREFSWEPAANGRFVISRYKENGHEWVLQPDKKSYRDISKPDSQPVLAELSLDGNANFSWRDVAGHTKETHFMDGSRRMENTRGGVLKYDRAGLLTELTTPEGETRKFRYVGKGEERAGQLFAVTNPDGEVWSSDDGKNWTSSKGNNWTGTIDLDQKGNFTSIDNQGFEVHRGFTARAENVSRAATVEEMKAIQYAMNGPDGYDQWLGGGCDQKTLFAVLERCGPAQRRLIEKLWNEKYQAVLGHDLRTELKQELGDGSQFQKAMNLLDKQDRTDGKGDFIGDLKYSLLDRSQWAKDRSAAESEACIRRTLAAMTAADIAEAEASFNRDGKTLAGAIAASSLSKGAKETAAILMKGADRRTDADTLALADIALNNSSIELFGEAWANATPTAREQFLQANGEARMKATFGASFWGQISLGLAGNATDKDLIHAADYQKLGKLSLATIARESCGWVTDSVQSVELRIDNLSDEERKAYMRGKELSAGEHGNLNKQDADALEYYKSTRAALQSIAGTRISSDSQKAELAKWEDMIETRGGSLISKLVNHRGYVWNETSESVFSDIENLSKSDFVRLRMKRANPDFQARLGEALDTLKGYVTSQSNSDVERAKTLLNEKSTVEADLTKLSDADRNKYEIGKKLALETVSTADLKAEQLGALNLYLDKTYEASKVSKRRDVLEVIRDNAKLHYNDPKKIFEAIEHMRPDEVARYRSNEEYRTKLNNDIAGAVWSRGELRTAYSMLQRVLDGHEPKMSVQEKLIYRASCWTRNDTQVVRDVLEAFAKDPSLRDRLASTEPADKDFRDSFRKMLSDAMGPTGFEDLGKALAAGKNPDLAAQLKKSAGTFYPYEELYRDAAAASEHDRQLLLNDKSKLNEIAAGLPSPAVLINCLQQGEMRPEDKLRAYMQGFGASSEEIKTLFRELKDRDRVRQELSQQKAYKGKPVPDAVVTGTINSRLEQIRTAYALKYGESLNQRLLSELGWEASVSNSEALSSAELLRAAQQSRYDTRTSFSGVAAAIGWDSSLSLEDSLHLEAQGKQVETAATGREIPIEDARDMTRGLERVADLRAEAEKALIDAGVDTTLTLATLALLVPSGGSSAGLLALTRAAQAGNDVAKVARLELLAKYLQGAHRVFELGAAGTAGGTFKVGAHAAFDSRFDIGRDGASMFADGFAMTVGNMIGGNDLMAFHGVMKESGAKVSKAVMRSMAKCSECLAADAKEKLAEGATLLLRDAVASGRQTLNKKDIALLAESVLKAGSDELKKKSTSIQLADELAQKLQVELGRQSLGPMKRLALETALNIEGGAIGGAAAGLAHWDTHAGVDSNLRSVLGNAALGGALSGGIGAGLKAGWSAGEQLASVYRIAPELESIARKRTLLKHEHQQLSDRVSALEAETGAGSKPQELNKLKKELQSKAAQIEKLDGKIVNDLDTKLQSLAAELEPQELALRFRRASLEHEVKGSDLKSLELKKSSGATLTSDESDMLRKWTELAEVQAMEADCKALIANAKLLSPYTTRLGNAVPANDFDPQRFSEIMVKARMVEIALSAERGVFPRSLERSAYYFGSGDDVRLSVGHAVPESGAMSVLNAFDERLIKPERLNLHGGKPASEGEHNPIAVERLDPSTNTTHHKPESEVTVFFGRDNTGVWVYDHELGHALLWRKVPAEHKARLKEAYKQDLEKAGFSTEVTDALKKLEYVDKNLAHTHNIGQDLAHGAYVACFEEVVAESFKLFMREKEAQRQLSFDELLGFVTNDPTRQAALKHFEKFYEKLKNEVFEPEFAAHQAKMAKLSGKEQSVPGITNPARPHADSPIEPSGPRKSVLPTDSSDIPTKPAAVADNNSMPAVAAERVSLREQRTALEARLKELEKQEQNQETRKSTEHLKSQLVETNRRLADLNEQVQADLRTRLSNFGPAVEKYFELLEHQEAEIIAEQLRVSAKLKQIKEAEQAGGLDEKIKVEVSKLNEQWKELVLARKHTRMNQEHAASVKKNIERLTKGSPPVKNETPLPDSVEELSSIVGQARLTAIALQAEKGNLPKSLPQSKFVIPKADHMTLDIGTDVPAGPALDVLDAVPELVQVPDRLALVNNPGGNARGEAKRDWVEGADPLDPDSKIKKPVDRVKVNFTEDASNVETYFHEVGHVQLFRADAASEAIVNKAHGAAIKGLDFSNDIKMSLHAYEYISPELADAADYELESLSESELLKVYLSCRDEVFAEGFKLFEIEKRAGREMSYQELLEHIGDKERREVMKSFENFYRTVKRDLYEPSWQAHAAHATAHRSN